MRKLDIFLPPLSSMSLYPMFLACYSPVSIIMRNFFVFCPWQNIWSGFFFCSFVRSFVGADQKYSGEKFWIHYFRNILPILILCSNFGFLSFILKCPNSIFSPFRIDHFITSLIQEYDRHKANYYDNNSVKRKHCKQIECSCVFF